MSLVKPLCFSYMSYNVRICIIRCASSALFLVDNSVIWFCKYTTFFRNSTQKRKNSTSFIPLKVWRSFGGRSKWPRYDLGMTKDWPRYDLGITPRLVLGHTLVTPWSVLKHLGGSCIGRGDATFFILGNKTRVEKWGRGRSVRHKKPRARSVG